MAVGEIIRRELRFDIRNGDVAAHAYVLALEKMREPEIYVVHDGIEAVKFFGVGALAAEYALREGVLVIRTVNSGKAETPIDMIELNLIGGALDVQRRLIELHGVGLERIGRRRVAAAAGRVVELGMRCADVAARLYPAINRKAAVLEFLAAGAAIQRIHQRAVVHVVDADGLRAADIPRRVRPRGIGHGNFGAADNFGGRRIRIRAVPGQVRLIAVLEARKETLVLRSLGATRHRAIRTGSIL